MMPLGFLNCLTLLPCVAQSADHPVPAEERDRPNAILIMADDLGWGDVGFNGGTVIQTPHLDEMAAASLRFERFYAAAPVCSPTRGSVLTGRHPYRYGIHGANQGHLKSEEWTLYEALSGEGYTTGHFGKWHLGTLTKVLRESNRGGPRGAAHYSPPWEHAVDVSFATEAKTPTFDPMHKPLGAGSRFWPAITEGEVSVPYGTHYWIGDEQPVDPDSDELRGDDSRVIMDRAIEFLTEAVAADRPFVATVWFHAPHLPVVASPEFIALYPDASPYEASYYGCITALDEQIGRLRACLRELRVAENTIVAFCSDNGPEGIAGDAPGSAGPLRGRKRDLYEGGIRVPGLLEWPARIRAPRSTSIPCGTIDYLPTLLDAAGVAPPADRPMDGISLLPLITGEMSARPTPMEFQSAEQLALIDGRYKIHSRDRGENFALFDLVADVGERTDLADERPELRRRMTGTLFAWQASCRASDQDSGDD